MVDHQIVRLIFLGAITFLLMGPAGLGPFQEEPGVSTCLGTGDPFCTGGSPSGGGSTNCYSCKTTIGPGGVIGPPACRSGSHGDTCTVTYQPNGDIECEVSGSSCSSATVTP